MRLRGSSSVLIATAAAGITAHHGTPVAECTASSAAAPAVKKPRSVEAALAASVNTSAAVDDKSSEASDRPAVLLLGSALLFVLEGSPLLLALLFVVRPQCN